MAAKTTPQTAKPSQVAGAGWLAPDGRWYPCNYGQHDTLAYALHEDGTPALERDGWIHIYDDGHPAHRISQMRPTQAQLNALWDLAHCEDTAIDPDWNKTTPAEYRETLGDMIERLFKRAN